MQVQTAHKGFGFAAEDVASDDYSDFNTFLDSLGIGGDWWYGGGGAGGDIQNTLDWWNDLTSGRDTSWYGQPVPVVNDVYYGGGGETWATQAGVQSLLDWWRDLTSGGGSTPASTGGGMVYGSNLPGYCPQGYYHPLNDPYACVPFPDDPTQKQQAQKQAQQQQQQAKSQAQAFPKPQNQNCPQGYQAVRMPDGKIYCVLPNANKPGGQTNWLLWLMIALGAIIIIRKL